MVSTNFIPPTLSSHFYPKFVFVCKLEDLLFTEASSWKPTFFRKTLFCLHTKYLYKWRRFSQVVGACVRRLRKAQFSELVAFFSRIIYSEHCRVENDNFGISKLQWYFSIGHYRRANICLGMAHFVVISLTHN